MNLIAGAYGLLSFSFRTYIWDTAVDPGSPGENKTIFPSADNGFNQGEFRGSVYQAPYSAFFRLRQQHDW